MKLYASAVASLLFASSALAKVYYKETFDSNWESRWVQSKSKSDYGVMKRTNGKFYGDAEIDMGIQTSQDARFYAISSKIPESFSNKGSDLVFQFSVKHEQTLDCGGGYLKIMPEGLDQAKFNGDSVYNIMFGPDICGSTKRIHVIINYKGENWLIEETIRPESDEGTHVYTLVISPDQTFKVLVDQKEVKSGKIEDNWKMLGEKKIKDPKAKKPEDWDDKAKIPDPEDTKPADWDTEPEFIPDPEAEKPEDWDDEMDGEWAAPKISNPEYKGKWTPKLIENPAYQGVWVHPEIDNPEYKFDSEIYAFKSNAFVGIDIWQVKSGSIFDNILIADSLEDAKKFYAETTGATIGGERKMKENSDEEKRKKAEEEAERAKQDAPADGDEEEGGDDYQYDEDFEGEERAERDEL